MADLPPSSHLLLDSCSSQGLPATAHVVLVSPPPSPSPSPLPADRPVLYVCYAVSGDFTRCVGACCPTGGITGSCARIGKCSVGVFVHDVPIWLLALVTSVPKHAVCLP